MKLIGCARVSTEDQNLELQKEALEAAGCAVVYVDKSTGADMKRGGLSKALAQAVPGDVLVVWKLDRLSRSLFDLVHLMRIPGDADHDSGAKAIGIPGSCRSGFRDDGDHDSGLMPIKKSANPGTAIGMIPERS